MNQYFLRFPDEATARQKLQDNALLMRDDDSDLYDKTIEVDIIGELAEAAVYSDDGILLVPPLALAGFHVNLLCRSLPTELSSFAVKPRSPLRVFAID